MARKVTRGWVIALVVALSAATGLFAPVNAAAYHTSAITSWVPNGRVYAMVEARGVVYLGGTFTSMRNPVTGRRLPRSRIAAVDALTGQPIRGWNPGANDTVRALAVGHDGTLYAGGSFTRVAGKVALRVAAIAPNGSLVRGWRVRANRLVRSIVVDRDGVYVAGNFTRIDGRPRIGVAKLKRANGDLVLRWNARVSQGRPRALTLSPDGNRLILGGTFKQIAGSPRPFIGAVAVGNGSLSDWEPEAHCEPCPVDGLAVGNGQVYAAVAGRGGRAMAWRLDTGDLSWVQRGDGNVQSVAVHDGVAYFGGHFGPDFVDETRHQFVALDAVTGEILDFQLSFTGNDIPGIWAIIATDTVLRIAGGFRLAGSPIQRYAAFPAL